MRSEVTVFYFDTVRKEKPYIRPTGEPSEIRLDPKAVDGTPGYLLFASYRLLWLRQVNPVYWVLDGGVLREATRQEKGVEDARLLALAKVAKNKTIDARSDALIVEGFAYPNGAAARYSLRPHSQSNLTNMMLAVLVAQVTATPPLLTFPVSYASIDDRTFAVLNNANDVIAFYTAAFGRVSWAKVSGTALKALVESATDMSELDSITDAR